MIAETNTDNRQQVEAAAKAVLPEDVVRFIQTCRQGPEPASQLIAVLHRVQQRLGYLGTEQLDAVAQLLGVPAAKVSGVPVSRRVAASSITPWNRSAARTGNATAPASPSAAAAARSRSAPARPVPGANTGASAAHATPTRPSPFATTASRTAASKRGHARPGRRQTYAARSRSVWCSISSSGVSAGGLW